MPKLILKDPIKLEKSTIDALNFRDQSTAEDYLSFDKKGGVAQMISLIANMTGNDEALILRLSGKDYLRAVTMANNVLAQDDEPLEKKSSASPSPLD